MWTPEQQEEIQKIAKETIPGIRTYVTHCRSSRVPCIDVLHPNSSAAIPTGLQVANGPDAVVTFLKEKIDEIMA
jgi:hypothetical protein